MKKIVILCFLFVCYACKTKEEIYIHTFDTSVRQDVHLQKSFYKLDSLVIANVIPTKLRLDKVFFMSCKTNNIKGKYVTSYMVLPQNEVEAISNNFSSSFLKLTPVLGKSHSFNMNELLWTDKNLNHLYENFSFNNNVINLEDLVVFSQIEDDEIIFLPLIRIHDFQYNFIDWRYDNNITFLVAFYIFDKKQIYYANSIHLSKRTFIKNSINPKDTQFLQSESDYLVYEALRPLLEKGVELEIRSP